MTCNLNLNPSKMTIVEAVTVRNKLMKTQGEPAKDQRGAPDDAAMPNKNSEHIGAKQPSGSDNNVIHPATAPHHHSRTEQKENPMKITDEMVSRFLAWQLPKEFAPDGGVAFTPPQNPHHAWPVGTNLLTATQARVMLEHVLVAEPAPAREPVHNDWSKAKAKVLAKYPAAQYEAMQGYLPPYGHIVWINHKRDAPSDRGYGLSNATSEQEAWLEAARNLPAPAREPAVEEVQLLGAYWLKTASKDWYDLALRHAEELDRLRAERRSLREQLQGGVVVPRELLQQWADEMEHTLEFCESHNLRDASLKINARTIRAMLAAAKEAKK